ncbi:MAG: hydrogenase formation protein HypD [Candidatus Aminicenantaceae bacterium]
MDTLKQKKTIQSLLSVIKEKTSSLNTPIRLMEVCGTHTMALHRSGLKTRLEEAGVEMLSGPGCPVCITPNEIHEAAIQLVTENRDIILASFGDMTRVPTSRGSLQTVVPAPGSAVKVVYSPEEALKLAERNPEKEVVFFGVGFETTIPAVALTVRSASEKKLANFSLLPALWLVPPPLRALVSTEDLRLHGFLYPGHVSAIIGIKPYQFLADEFGVPGAVSGFEPGDILLGVSSIADQIKSGKARVDNMYKRAVRTEGNPLARSVMDEMLEPQDSHWRGLGMIPLSGLKLKKAFHGCDAVKKFGLTIEPGGSDLPGCRCGEVLQGRIRPHECPLFGESCIPESPQGPCMVSFEGACLAHYKYR